MPERQTFLKDKPYEFVPLLRECRKEKYSGHHVMEKDTYTGKLKLKLTTLSPLHIGGGNQDYDENGNCQDCKKEDFFQRIEAAGPERKMEFRGRKFYSTGREDSKEASKKTCFEMLEPGSVLEGEIIVQNLKETEGQLLAYALDVGSRFTMKLGYGKPLGYGKVKIELESVENLENRYSFGKKISKEIVENWGEKYRTDNPDEIREVLKEFERIMS